MRMGNRAARDAGSQDDQIGTIAPLYVDKRTGSKTAGPAQPLTGTAIPVREF